MSESAPESSGGGSLDSAFSRRYGPLTGLQWTGVAVAGGGLYIWYRRKQAASTASSSSSGQATAYGYTGQPYDYGPSIAAQQSEIQALQAGQSTSTPATSSTGTSTARTVKRFPDQRLGTQIGSGYGVGSGTSAADQTVTVNGTTYTWITPQQGFQANATGQQLYFQPSPGVFSPAQPGERFGQGTPLFTSSG